MWHPAARPDAGLSVYVYFDFLPGSPPYSGPRHELRLVGFCRLTQTVVATVSVQIGSIDAAGQRRYGRAEERRSRRREVSSTVAGGANRLHGTGKKGCESRDYSRSSAECVFGRRGIEHRRRHEETPSDRVLRKTLSRNLAQVGENKGRLASRRLWCKQLRGPAANLGSVRSRSSESEWRSDHQSRHLAANRLYVPQGGHLCPDGQWGIAVGSQRRRTADQR